MSEQVQAGTARLERGYRRVLACYPRSFRAENADEVLAVLLAAAAAGQARVGWAEGWDLVVRLAEGGVAQAVEPAHTPGSSRAARQQRHRPTRLQFFLQISQFGWDDDPAGKFKGFVRTNPNP